MADYFTKRAKEIKRGDFVMIAGSPPFVVGKAPKHVVVDDPRGHVLIEGRTRLGSKASGIAYGWDHKVLCQG